MRTLSTVVWYPLGEHLDCIRIIDFILFVCLYICIFMIPRYSYDIFFSQTICEYMNFIINTTLRLKSPLKIRGIWAKFSGGREVMEVMGGRFQNWVGTSYLNEIDAWQKDLPLSDTLNHPNQWSEKSDFFWWFMSFVRVPPYESWANWTNFYFSWENGDISFVRKSCNLLHTKNEEKSQKISTLVRISTCVYANPWQGGHIVPPPRPE